MMRLAVYCLMLIVLFLIACDSRKEVELNIREDVAELVEKFAPVEITTDITFLPENEKAVLLKLLQASRLMDEIFLRQVYEKNPAYRRVLSERTDGPGKNASTYFQISYGLWDRLDEHEAPFINSMERPKGAGYYPVDMTKAEFENFVAANSDLADTIRSEFTLVRRQGANLVAIPYSEAYAEWLLPSAKLLREAADLTENTSLEKYLRSRADAFLSNDYMQSDMDWMDLESAIEITIGPYEVYEDKLFNYKAAFESFVTVTDPDESQKLMRYKSELPAMERNLPIPDRMKNMNRGTESPIRVVDEVFTAGDTKAGVQTIAFNLPNNETVRELKGSKKVLLRNVIEAKYERILYPISKILMEASQLQYLSARAFTNEVLFHELAHGLGPGKITIDGRETQVRFEIKEFYSGLEEAKADIMGVYNILFMIDKGVLPPEMRKEIAVTYFAGLFRSVRFGISEAHGKGAALQFNYMMEKGAANYDAATGQFSVDFGSFENWVLELVQDICILQAEGDYTGTKLLFEKYVVLPDVLTKSLAKVQEVPVDILPQYTLAEQLLSGTN